MVPLRYILPHMEAIMSVLDTNMGDYLGEEAYSEFISNYRHINFLPVVKARPIQRDGQ
jgi:hypothetical protein